MHRNTPFDALAALRIKLTPNGEVSFSVRFEGLAVIPVTRTVCWE